MIISHRHKFIFIKTNKTAGTSIEISLSQFGADGDVITPLPPEDEATRRNLDYRGPQNYLAPIADYGPKDLARLLIRGTKKHRYYSHISAREIKKQIGEGVWRDYYKFCFERNPWDRLISLYYWKNTSEPRPALSDFIESGAPSILKKRGIDLYTIDGEIVVDKVCLYENLEKDLEAVRTHLGLPRTLVLPRAKSSHRKDKRCYREILNREQQQRIGELFSREINIFGYEF
jgi:hypothetical protein